ncbi:MAG: Chromosome partition protein Smc [candidate division WS6 bacterium OLB20]|uniref:Chromosome partition protein Smc n=1 Tax=candidate division WS6 bacterium OLB20 TaxID=1617426 RepID=A0A136LY72_9BACT|nr:MAG: Chromosome partition protein Smc [candidate division WS6 bacterium OLB20]
MAGAPQIGQLKSEISSAEKQKGAVSNQRSELQKGISQMQDAISSIGSNITRLRSQLSGQIPPEARKQITDQLSKLNNQRKTLQLRLAKAREQLGQTSEAIKGISAGIAARKSALTRLTGQLTRMPMYNREMGTKKG